MLDALPQIFHADPRGEAGSSRSSGAEHHLAVAVDVGRVLGDRQHRLVVEGPAQRARRVAHGRGDDFARVLAVLI
jgi:hypothetical protein